jgi:hypothetical protein
MFPPQRSWDCVTPLIQTWELSWTWMHISFFGEGKLGQEQYH